MSLKVFILFINLLMSNCYIKECLSDLCSPQLSLAQMIHYWQKWFSYKISEKNSLSFSLVFINLLSWNETHDNYKNLSWQALLIRDLNALSSLNILKFKVISETLLSLKSLNICWCWDVNSFIALTISLEVYHDEFNFLYWSLYLQWMKQNSHVLFKDRTISKLKNLQIDQDLVSEDYDYVCHMFFLYMIITNKDLSNQLSDSQQRIWINDIILSALRFSCFNDILQHYSWSFVDADIKVWIKKKIYSHESEQAINVYYCILKTALNTFWNEVLQLCRTFSHQKYWEFFLIISEHDLKLYIKCDSVTQTQMNFLNHLNQCFKINDDYMSSMNCWLDLSLKNTSETEFKHSIMLLLKTTCCHHWMKHFECSQSYSALTMNHKYLYAITRDTVSILVVLCSSNILYDEDNMTYNKAYDLHKNIFATFLKSVESFDMT